jgi:GT2 family glycosyltransferase
VNNEPIDIVLIGWKRENFTARSIDAIAKNTTHPIKLTLILNEGISGEEVPAKTGITSFSNIVILSDNWGLEPAKNIGMSFVKSKYFISTDNDCLPMKPNEKGDWLTQLVELMDSHPEYGAISCRTQVMIGTGNIFDGHEDEDLLEFPHPGGSLRIMRTDLVKKIGGWRNDMRGRGSEEKYICEKIHQAGYKTGFAVKVKCYHLFGDGKHDWGYFGMKPEEHFHNDVAHPALDNPDDVEELKNYE